jgi:predicted NAD-dependent protein-ADP-ribosyltransferase YbiA (DUF1768 family)
MEQVLRLKLEQHYTRLAALLIQSGNREIVERSSKDDFWGAIPDGQGKLIGENVLGTLWMILRAQKSSRTRSRATSRCRSSLLSS